MQQFPPVVLPDTNYFIEFPSVQKENWLLPALEILISETVISELRGLTKDPDLEVARKARLALEEIDRFRGNAADLSESPLDLKVTFVERCTDPVEHLDPTLPDHQLIAHAIKLCNGDNRRFCAILSNDNKLCDIAEMMNVIAVSRHNEYRFHQEIFNKYEWWLKLQIAKKTEPAPVTKKKPGKVHDRLTDKRDLLDKSTKHLYRRIEAVGFRTTIYLAPLEARLALTLEVVKRLRSPDRQVVVVAVETDAMARYWAGDLRQIGNYSINEVQVFGFDQIDRLDHAKVVIYRHDQIARRLPQHIARLEQANKRVTAVVDGCDLLDPVELAILLFECNQFIGLNHFPIGYRNTRGHRMLSVILHDRSLINYSFTNAECDGWGTPSDLYLHKIKFTPDEHQFWDEINSNYIRRRERALVTHPELGEAEDFWKTLGWILDRTANPQLAELIKQREELEQLAQLAQMKLARIETLIRSAPKQPFRRLIFDFNRQWTQVLLKHFENLDINIAELPSDESQRSIWDQFAGNRLDTLILSGVPALDLPSANLHQLIILTPLRPMDEVLAMIDWALSHTHTKDAIRLDVLFAVDTPEEIAMLELAEASFELEYS